MSGPGVSRQTGPAAVELPRELVLASAGTGKTFRISSRIIGLLEAGAEVDHVLASTFTRKAAGEILDRVLLRLAEAASDEERAEELAVHGVLPGRSSSPGMEDWQRLLAAVVRRLDRMSVGTLDAFFVRAAGSFHLELGLPATWRIGDGPTNERLESEALEDILGGAARAEVLELVRALVAGDATRSVHGRILDQVGDLRSLLHQLDPTAPDPWDPVDQPDQADTTSRSGGDSRADLAAIADRLAAEEVPVNKDGSPNKGWASALARSCDAIRSGAWDDLLGAGIGKKIREGAVEYSRKPIPPGVESALRDAIEHCRREIRADLRRRGRALGDLAARFDAALARRQRSEGAYRFDDVTRLVGGVDPLGARADLWYRLDQRARHILLDEFQDTSLTQWEALRPLAEELLSGHAGERAAVVVADPKQSIYGWRGADPELVHRVGGSFHFDEDRLTESYRSSPVVLEFVNDVFGGMASLSLWEDEGDRALVESWLEDFSPHESARSGAPGRVRVEVGPREDDTRSASLPRMMRAAAVTVARIREESPGRSVGVLLRGNRNIPRLVSELRGLGIEASEEGGTHLTDSSAVVAFLALLRLADHPGDLVSRYHVSRSPLGPLVGIRPPGAGSGAGVVAVGDPGVSMEVRHALVEHGYGPTMDRWARALGRAGSLGERDVRRLFQLVELGFRWDAMAATLRPGDFVRFAESEKAEDPMAADVRVMTIHQSKGLEFDAVVLPELGVSLAGGGGRTPVAVAERDRDTGRVRKVFPYVKAAFQHFVPEADTALRQHRDAELRDALGVLYVGMTRARSALHLLVPADGKNGPGRGCTYARLVRESLGRYEDAVAEGDVLLDSGDRGWSRLADQDRRPLPDTRAEPESLSVELARSPRRRLLTHRTPSSLDGPDETALRDALALPSGGRRAARLRGDVIHEWCSMVGWAEDGLPPDAALLARARIRAPGSDAAALAELLADFRGWLEAPEIRRALSRPANRARARLERERRFAVRSGAEILEGSVDRLVLLLDEEGAVEAARVLDFKTGRTGSARQDEPGERPGAGEAARRLERYRRQVRAYVAAVRRIYRLSPDRVEGRLVLLEEGALLDVAER